MIIARACIYACVCVRGVCVCVCVCVCARARAHWCVCVPQRVMVRGPEDYVGTQSTKDIFDLGKIIDHYIHACRHPYTNGDSCINETIESFTKIICCVCCCVHDRKNPLTVTAVPAARTATTSPVTMRARLPSVFRNIFCCCCCYCYCCCCSMCVCVCVC